MASVGHWQYSLQLSSEQTNQPVQIIGKVDSLVTEHQDIRFNFSVSQLDNIPVHFNRKIRLSWREPQWQIQQGQVLQLLVKVKPPHGLANEAGFNYQQWLFSNGIVATGYVKNAESNKLVIDAPSLRQRLLNQLLVFNLPNESWLAALTFGYRGLLQPKDWQLVQKTGVAHLIAISGLHLALVASLSYLLVAWFGGILISRFDRLHVINLHRSAMVVTLVVTLAYSALAGFGLPTVRAWIMLTLVSVYFLTNKYIKAKSLILVGLCVFVLLFPLSIFGSSFWLSFSAVSIICLIFWRWPVKKNGFSVSAILLGMGKIQLCLTLLMLPLIAWQFSYISNISPFVNLIAVPLVTIILVPLCLLGAFCLLIESEISYDVFLIANNVLTYGLDGLKFFLNFDWAYFNIASFPIQIWMFVFLFLFILLLPKFWFKKQYLFILVLPLVSHLLPQQKDSWQIDVLDVGQGVAVLIAKNNRVVIYDVGALYPSGFNMADSVLLPILQARGINKVDKVLISHGDNDHAGSLQRLLKGIDVSEVITNQDSCNQSFEYNWQGLKFEALWPDDPSLYNDNNGSCVIKISDHNHSLLLPGDIAKSIESKLVNLYASALDVDILLAPHHGSNTSSSRVFVEAVNPDYVVFSQGFMNRWQFPREEVVSRYTENESIQFSTSISGQVSFIIKYNSSRPIQVKTNRNDIYPFWYANIVNP